MMFRVSRDIHRRVALVVELTGKSLKMLAKAAG
jgi:hypothetical protein